MKHSLLLGTMIIWTTISNNLSLNTLINIIQQISNVPEYIGQKRKKDPEEGWIT